jgi:hypothetical protein
LANPQHIDILRRGVAAWNSWRRRSPAIKPDLNSANLTAAKLKGINLSSANLKGAVLWEANLSRSELANADLSNADLNGTNFSHAHLDHTNLDAATLGWTVFVATDLSTIKHIESTRHTGPSFISVDTLLRSNGSLIEVFLRRAGIPELLISCLRKVRNTTESYNSCFISYSHTDRDFAIKLYESLQLRGIQCWLDEKELIPGHNIYERVDHGIRLHDKVLLCCSKQALTSWWVHNEIGSAFAKEQQITKEHGEQVQVVIPLNLDGFLFSNGWKSGFRTQLLSRVAADFRNWKRNKAKYDLGIQHVARALIADGLQQRYEIGSLRSRR